MATVTLNGTTFDSDDLANYGHLDPVTGFFAILVAMVAELAAADTVDSVAPGTAGNVLTSTGAGWASQAPASAADPTLASNLLAGTYFSF